MFSSGERISENWVRYDVVTVIDLGDPIFMGHGVEGYAFIDHGVWSVIIIKKKLSYRRETALQPV